MINYEEFCKYMMNDLQNYFVEQEKDCEVLLYHATKTNNVSRLGLTIKSAGSNISPTIYMEEFYEKLIDGSSIEDIRDELVNLYEYTVEKSPNIDFMDDFKLENIKDKIAMRMVNYKDNREMLSETPHKKVDDLAVYYVVVVGCNRDGTACMTIRNTHQEMLGITTDELHQIAMENTSKIFPPVLMRIEDKLSNQQAMQAPKPIIISNFLQTAQQVQKQKMPIRLKMIVPYVFWDEFENKQKCLNNSVEYSNDAMVIWEENRSGGGQ